MKLIPCVRLCLKSMNYIESFYDIYIIILNKTNISVPTLLKCINIDNHSMEAEVLTQ